MKVVISLCCVTLAMLLHTSTPNNHSYLLVPSNTVNANDIRFAA